MKTRFILLFLLIVCFSCGTNNKPLSDAQKEKIKAEVKQVADRMFQGCEEANFEMATALFLDSPDFVFVFNGVTMDYKGVTDGIKPLFSALLNQKVTITDERYAFLNNSNVIYTANCTFLENYKDGHAILSDPMVIQVTFKQINNKWVAINGVESSVRQNVKNEETAKELNQVELMQSVAGTWKGDVGKDTVCFYESKPYGTGLEANFKTITKGKVIAEGKELDAYDKNTDKYIILTMLNSGNIEISAQWFISKNKMLTVSYSNISNPKNADWKREGEFKSPDILVNTTMIDNKPIKSETWTRIK